MITFHYIDHENAATPPRNFDGVIIQEGKHSGKILDIAIPIDTAPLKTVDITNLRTKIMNALNKRMSTLKKNRVLNQEVAEEILTEDKLKELAGV